MSHACHVSLLAGSSHQGTGLCVGWEKPSALGQALVWSKCLLLLVRAGAASASPHDAMGALPPFVSAQYKKP